MLDCAVVFHLFVHFTFLILNHLHRGADGVGEGKSEAWFGQGLGLGKA